METFIQEGKFRQCSKLPSIRELCATYHCSQSTAVKAYDILKSKHLIYSVPQSGCYVMESRPKTEQTNSAIIDFSRGNPLFSSAFIPDLKHCLDRAVDICSTNSFAGQKLYGIPHLRKLLPQYLADFQVFATTENIFVNLGVQQALNILNQMPFPNKKDSILIEQPTFRYYNNFLKTNGAKILGIPRGKDGVDIDFLEALFKKEQIKFFYTVPSSHNPLGTCYSKEQRKAIARLAEKYDVYIVEDDYFGDITFGNYDPIYSYGDYKHHIYLKSFIKIIPWIRIGIAVVPSHLLPVFTEYVRYSYYHSYFSPSLVCQSTLEMYIRSNLLKKHVFYVKNELFSKLESLKMHFADAAKIGLEWVGGESGFYSYLKLPDCVNEAQFVENLKRRRGILVTAGSDCFVNKHYHKKGIRVSVARATVDDIHKGIPEIYNEYMRMNLSERGIRC